MAAWLVTYRRKVRYSDTDAQTVDGSTFHSIEVPEAVLDVLEEAVGEPLRGARRRSALDGFS